MCLGVPAKIKEILDSQLGIAKVETSGVFREANIALLLSENMTSRELIGKWVLLHVGFAMAIIDEAEAEQTLETLRELQQE